MLKMPHAVEVPHDQKHGAGQVTNVFICSFKSSVLAFILPKMQEECISKCSMEQKSHHIIFWDGQAAGVSGF